MTDATGLERIRRALQASVGVGAILLGAAAFTWLVRSKPAPAQGDHRDRIPDVVVRAVEPTISNAPVEGHGTVRAKSQISIVPQVSGTLVYVHPELAQGRIIPKGTLLFQIDKAMYEARVHQSEAEVQGLEAALARHDQEAINLQAQIETARQLLAIDESDFETSRKLYEEQQVGTRRDLDLVQQRYLRQKSGLIELENKLAMIPHLRREAQAQLESAKARLEQSKYDLESTTIACPFDARVESVAAHRSQFVSAHLSIATLTDVSALEISVGLDPRDLRWLAETARPEALNEANSTEHAPQVKVRWSLHGQEFFWTGRVTRFEKVDEATRTARMVVEVRREDFEARIAVGEEHAPSLSIGMYCTAELPATVLTDALLVPRHAVYDNQWVYVYEPDESGSDCGRLERRRVPLLRTMGDQVLVDYRGRRSGEVCELAAGDLVVVSPLTKPVEGMPLRLRRESPSPAEARATREPWNGPLALVGMGAGRRQR